MLMSKTDSKYELIRVLDTPDHSEAVYLMFYRAVLCNNACQPLSYYLQI